MAVLAALCFAAILRLGPAALAGLAPWVLVGLAMVAAGEAWPMEVLGAGVVGLLAAAVVQATGLADASAGVLRRTAAWRPGRGHEDEPVEDSPAADLAAASRLAHEG
jgi:hypothetical protein